MGCFGNASLKFPTPGTSGISGIPKTPFPKQHENSLEQTLREENLSTSFPVVTISQEERLKESVYRSRCAERLLEIILELDNYLGVGRVFIP